MFIIYYTLYRFSCDHPEHTLDLFVYSLIFLPPLICPLRVSHDIIFLSGCLLFTFRSQSVCLSGVQAIEPCVQHSGHFFHSAVISHLLSGVDKTFYDSNIFMRIVSERKSLRQFIVTLQSTVRLLWVCELVYKNICLRKKISVMYREAFQLIYAKFIIKFKIF